tara:strand:+ start:940 stop:1269 length:330 start_codon:yes stop_codon:yes gene_type:complete
MKNILLLTILLMSLLIFLQAQLGSGIDGDAADDESKYSVSIDSDGSHVAIRAYLNDKNGMLAVNYQTFVPVLINALKELENDTSSLESQMSMFEKIIPELIDRANQNKK